MSTQDILKERGSRYGKFKDNAYLSQALKLVARDGSRWLEVGDVHAEAIDMTFVKISRMINGDPSYMDNVDDIIGFWTLVKEHLEDGIRTNKTPEATCTKEVLPDEPPGYGRFVLSDMSKMYQKYLASFERSEGDQHGSSVKLTDVAIDSQGEVPEPREPMTQDAWEEDRGWRLHLEEKYYWHHSKLNRLTPTELDAIYQEYRTTYLND